MSIDISTLRLLKYRSRYDAMARAVPARALAPRTVVLLKDFGRFFKEFPTADRVTPSEFGIFFASIHPKVAASVEDMAIYEHLFVEMQDDVDDGTASGLMRRLIETATASDLADRLQKFEAGEEVDLRSDLMGFLEVYDTQLGKVAKNPQVLDPIEDLMKAETDASGLTWRLPCLNTNMRPLQAGDFVVVAARPDKGKTTFLTDQLTHMAPQLDLVWPGENRSILWFNNEGPGKRIVTRTFQSALNVTPEELVTLVQQPDRDFRNVARRRYIEAVGGRGGALRVFDVHDYGSSEVEDIIRKYNPGLLVFDMIDNIRFNGLANNGGERTDQLLEAMYQWARVRGVKYDCPVIANSQLSADADGVAYPTLPQLKDSKTGKQGAADVILTIGASNDVMLENSRFIGATKNKLRRTGQPNSPRCEVIFDAARGRYKQPAA